MKRAIEVITQSTVFLALIVGIIYFLGIIIDNYPSFWKVINSQLFVAMITLFAGAVAYILYLKQKSDEKIQIARVLLLEIRTAEERIGKIKEKVQENNTNDLPSVFPSRSWKQHSYLFVSDFDQDELKLIGSFYDYGELIEDFVRRNNDFFWVTTEERARVIQQKLADVIINSKQENATETENLKNRLKRDFLDEFSNDPYSYAPQKTIDGIRSYTEKISQITTTSAGAKLKRLARMS